jgi:hypothetical protein
MAVDRWENHLPSGNWLQSANLKMVIYVVVLPIFYMVIFHGYVNVYQRILRTALLFLLLLLFLVIAFSGYYDFHCPVLKVSQPFLPNPGLVATV